MTITAGAAQSTRTGMYSSSYRLPSLNKRKSTATCSRFFQPRVPRGMMLWKAGNKPRPIYRLLQNMPMGPEEIDRLTTAYEQALRTLGMSTEVTHWLNWVAQGKSSKSHRLACEPSDISAALAVQEIDIRSSLNTPKVS
jgi:hypothetical protein